MLELPNAYWSTKLRWLPSPKTAKSFQIEGFDDGGGRIIVKLAIGGLKVTLNEFMAQPISKQEFATYGKVLSEYSSIRDDDLNLAKITSQIQQNMKSTNPVTWRIKQ